jgi:hypothetical protein
MLRTDDFNSRRKASGTPSRLYEPLQAQSAIQDRRQRELSVAAAPARTSRPGLFLRPDTGRL